jgi:hypothetical protein
VTNCTVIVYAVIRYSQADPVTTDEAISARASSTGLLLLWRIKPLTHLMQASPTLGKYQVANLASDLF